MNTSNQHWRLLWGGLCLVSLVGCYTNDEGFDKRWYLTTESSTYSFDTIDLGVTSAPKAIWLSNSGKKAIKLGRMDQTSLGLSTDTFDVIEEQSTCKTSLVLQPGAECQIQVTATPWVETLLVEAMNLAWTNDVGQKAQSRKITLQVKGRLDCMKSTELVDNYNQGAADGINENETQFELGYAQGMQATYSEGWSKGYNSTYSSSYNSAYENAYSSAYSSAYDDAYSDAYIHESVGDACAEGSEDGFNDGYYNGFSVGSNDGYDYGWNDGSGIGYSDGYWYGYDEGYYTCSDEYTYYSKSSSSDSAIKKILSGSQSKTKYKAASEKSFEELCYDKGFAETYESDSLSKGESEGLADNKDYQSGKTNGQAQGRTDGTNKGTAEGNLEGASEGTSEGTVDGAEAADASAYALCYDDEYTDGYTTGYYVGFDEYYNLGYNDGYIYGWDLGYSVGWDDGCDDANYDEGTYYMTSTNRSKAYGKSVTGKTRVAVTTPMKTTVLVSKVKIKSARSSGIEMLQTDLSSNRAELKRMSQERSLKIKLFNRPNRSTNAKFN